VFLELCQAPSLLMLYLFYHTEGRTHIAYPSLATRYSSTSDKSVAEKVARECPNEPAEMDTV
jgi:hypothetical protein